MLLLQCYDCYVYGRNVYIASLIPGRRLIEVASLIKRFNLGPTYLQCIMRIHYTMRPNRKWPPKQIGLAIIQTETY